MSNVTNKQKVEKLRTRLAKELARLQHLSKCPVVEGWDEMSKIKRSNVSSQNRADKNGTMRRIALLNRKLAALGASTEGE